MKSLPHTHSCFVCGESNPFGLKLRFETDGRMVQTRFVPRAEHIGFKGVVHGGIMATVLDEIMVWACAVPTHKFAYCAELTVRYLQPVIPGAEIVVTGELVANRKDRIYEAKAAAFTALKVTLAEATGNYLPIKSIDLSDMAQDFVGDPAWFEVKLD